MYILEDDMPHIATWDVQVSAGTKFNLKRIIDAGKDLKKITTDIYGLVSFLPLISNGFYDIIEVIYAGVILHNGIDGAYHYGHRTARAKYVRIDKVDYILTKKGVLFDNQLFGDNDKFVSDDGKVYKLKKETVTK